MKLRILCFVALVTLLSSFPLAASLIRGGHRVTSFAHYEKPSVYVRSRLKRRG